MSTDKRKVWGQVLAEKGIRPNPKGPIDGIEIVATLDGITARASIPGQAEPLEVSVLWPEVLGSTPRNEMKLAMERWGPVW